MAMRMPRNANFGGTRRTGKGRFARFVHVALVLSLWHAPIPWVHTHELVGPQVDSRQLLSQHIAEFHSRELSRGEERLDWHLHLVLPWCLVHHLPCPDGDHPRGAFDDLFDGAKVTTGRTVSLDLFGQPATRAFLAWDSSIADARALHCAAAADSARGALDRARHFFETYGHSIGIEELIGVRLC